MDKRVIITFIGTIIITLTLLGLKACRKVCIIPVITAEKTIAEIDMEIEFSVISESDEEINWTFGDGQTAIGTSVKHSYSKSGSYNVMATYNLECQSLPVNVEIKNPTPKVIKALALNITTPDKIEAESEVTFNVNNPELSAYEWQVIETSTISKESFLSVSFPTEGVFTIKLSANGDGYRGDTTFIVNVLKKSKIAIPVPTALAVVAPNVVYTGKNVSVICTTPYLTQYAWVINETAQNFAGKSFQTKFEKSGNYTIKLAASGSVQGKSFSLTKNLSIVVKDAPVAAPVPVATPVISDSELSELFIKLSNELSNDESDASDEWKDKIASLDCGKQIVVNVSVDNVLVESISIEQFKKKQILANTYLVTAVSSLKRGAKGCILQVSINTNKN
jgi:PKD repeat protein